MSKRELAKIKDGKSQKALHKIRMAKREEMNLIHGLKSTIIEKPSRLKSRIVISITTLPSRINKIEPLFNCLKLQTYKPDVIYLNIPHESKREKKEYAISDEIMKYSEFIIFNHIEMDYGPLTKLLGVLPIEDDGNTIIITLDDDKLYDKHTIENLVYYAELYTDCAIGRRGWILKRPEFTWPNFSYLPNAIDIKEPTRVDVLTGVSGVAYRRRFFGDDIFDLDLIKKCFTVDDIYINGYLAKNGIKRLLIPSTPNEFMKTKKTSHLDNTYIHTSRLWDVNKDGKNNNTALELFKNYF